ncbi:MAG: helix-turn-helix transcriptional regulator [Flavobacteriales bacterium]|nr:helix-turn-helix transcriptional regulator [Flavobacteriales bacterium]
MKDDLEKYKKKLVSTLKNERAKRDISHEKLAARTGISRQAISKIESGQRSPAMYTVKKIAEGLGMTLAEFVTKMDLD